MTHVDAVEIIDPHRSGHEGSAAMRLTGRGVAGAWVLSVLVHTVAFASMFLLVFPFSPNEEPRLPVAHAQVIGEIDAVPTAAANVPDKKRQRDTPDPLAKRFTPNRDAVALAKLVQPRSLKAPEFSILGIRAGSVGALDLSKYGLSAGGGAGPEFFGVGGSAPGVRSIVYVVDRSGSMVDTFLHVRAELKRSISALRRSQKFHVIFFNSGAPLENPPRRLVNAIDAHRRDFFKFLDNVAAGGGTRPELALRRALAMEPDLIYLLSDGISFDPDLPAKLDAWNRGRHTRIYTIAYLDQGGREILEGIAREHGGEFKFVSEYDLP